MRCARASSSSPAEARGPSATACPAFQSRREGRAGNVLLELLLEALMNAVAKVLDRVLAALQDDRRLVVRQLAARLGVAVLARPAHPQRPLPASARATGADRGASSAAPYMRTRSRYFHAMSSSSSKFHSWCAEIGHVCGTRCSRSSSCDARQDAVDTMRDCSRQRPHAR